MIFGNISADGPAEATAKWVFALPPPTLLIKKLSAIRHPANLKAKSTAKAAQSAKANMENVVNIAIVAIVNR